MDSDLIMAVDAKFNSILKEIQQSKLNFAINLTPFSASITLKKSSQVDQNGVQLLPTPPILRLLEQSLNEKMYSEAEINKLKAELELSQKQCQVLTLENEALREKLCTSNQSLVTTKDAYDLIDKKFALKEKELVKAQSERKESIDKLSSIEKKNYEVVCDFELEVKALKKTVKSKEKEIHNLVSKLNNSKDIIANLKSNLSDAQALKTTLEKSIRSLEKKLKLLQSSSMKKSVSIQTQSTIDTPYLITEALPPIFGSHLCLQSKSVHRAKSLPDLAHNSWVANTEEDVIREKAEQVLNEEEDDVMKCKVCGLVFQSQQELENHDKAYTFCCWQCSTCYRTIKEAQDHSC